MKLIIHELNPSVFQKVRSTSVQMVTSIRPHIYRHMWPVGDLVLKVYDEAETLVATSNVVNISDIGALDYWHGYVRFDISLHMKRDHSYKVVIEGVNGYTYAPGAYVGISNDTHFRKYDTTFEHNEYGAPLDLEIFKREEK